MSQNPEKFLTSSRFDLGAKLLFGNHYLESRTDNWSFAVYKEHIRTFNNFVETDQIKKIGINQFKSAFQSILKSFELNGFDKSLDPLPIGENNVIEDGAHRLAAAILTGSDIYTASISRESNYNYEYFKKRGLEGDYMDAMALELLRWKPSLRLLILYPSVINKEDYYEKKAIENVADIFYSKEIFVKATDGKHFIQEIYKDEFWVGGHGDSFKGAKRKARSCFPKDGYLRVYLIEPKGQTDLVDFKDKLRSHYKLEKHSVHSTDTYDETKYLGNIFFNDNTLKYIRLNQVYLSRWNTILFKELNEIIKEFNIDSDHLIIHGSFLLSLLEVREARDLDIVVNPDKDYKFSSSNIGLHNEELKELDFDVFDLLYNPKNFFWYRGVKIVSPNALMSYKVRRNEFKDQKDISGLKSYANKKSYLSRIQKIQKEVSSKYNKKVIKFYIKKYLNGIKGKN